MFLFSLLLQKLVPVLMSVFSTNVSSWWWYWFSVLVGLQITVCVFWLFNIRPTCTCFLRVWVKFCKSSRFIKHRSRNRPYLNFWHWSMSVVTLADQLLCTFQRKTGALFAIKIFYLCSIHERTDMDVILSTLQKERNGWTDLKKKLSFNCWMHKKDNL